MYRIASLFLLPYNCGMASRKASIILAIVSCIIIALFFMPFLANTYQLPGVDEHGNHIIETFTEWHSIFNVAFSIRVVYLAVFVVIGLLVAIAALATSIFSFAITNKINTYLFIAAASIFVICLLFAIPNVMGANK